MECADDILIIDDDAPIRELLVDVLQEEGYSVRTAYDNDSLLAALNERLPALLLLDIIIPGLDSGAFLAYLRTSLRSDMPVILLTATSAGAAEHLVEQGATEYLLKPFDIEELLLGVARYLRPGKSIAQGRTQPLAHGYDPKSWLALALR